MSAKKELILGIIIGLLLAFLFSLLMFYTGNIKTGMPTEQFFDIFVKGKIIVPVLSISLLANFALFFIFLKFNKDNISRGIMVATMAIGAVIIILKISI